MVLERDPVCMLCHSAPSAEADHIDPDGPDTLENLQGACTRCHRVKSAAEGGRARASVRRRIEGLRRRPAEVHPSAPTPGG